MKKHEFIPGTDAGSVYKVIARKGRIRLSIKPAFTSTNPCLIGWNLRAACPAEDVGDTPVTVYEITSAFPKIHFDKKDYVRASKVQVSPLLIKATNPKSFIEGIENFIEDKEALTSLVSHFLNKLDVDASEYGTDKDIANYVSEYLGKALNRIKVKNGLTKPVNEDKIKAEVNDLLAGIFKSK